KPRLKKRRKPRLKPVALAAAPKAAGLPVAQRAAAAPGASAPAERADSRRISESSVGWLGSRTEVRSPHHPSLRPPSCLVLSAFKQLKTPARRRKGGRRARWIAAAPRAFRPRRCG